MPSVRPSRLLFLFLLATFLLPTARTTQAADQLAAPHCPMAAHNAYTWRLYGNQRLPRALAAGLQHIEVDVSWDPTRQVIVVTHDHPPRGGEPELAPFLVPLWKSWKSRGGTGYTLIIDFKTSDPACAAQLTAVLQPHADQLSSLPKAGGDFRPGAITVCLTGSQTAHQHYFDSLPNDGSLLAFGDRGLGGWPEDTATAVPADPPGFVRFLTIEKSFFCESPGARGNAPLSVARLRSFMQVADARGYRVRVYTLNPTRGADGQYDLTAWDRCLEAGVHMLATDAYELARDYWNRHAAPR